MNCTNYGCMTFGAAFPWDCKGEEPDVKPAIQMAPICKLPDFASRTSDAAQGVLAQLTKEVEDLDYLPENSSRFTQLIYYANLKDHQSPYSEKDLLLMERCHYADQSTKIWLRIGFVSALGAPLAAWGLNSPWLTAASLTIAVATNAISWIATGSNPDFKSDSANERQDALHKMSSSLEQMAIELLELSLSDPHLAVWIANSLDIEKIQKKMIDLDPKAKEAPLKLNSLQAAKDYCLNNPLSDRAPVAIRNAIVLCEIRRTYRQVEEIV